jgi:hypothetical protein
MDEHLKSMWEDINKMFFDGKLKELLAIDWGAISGEGTMEAFGRYFQKSKCMIIADRFQFDAARVGAGDEKEGAKAEVAYRLMIHEMIHQALHQRRAPSPGKHRDAFIAEATRIAQCRKEQAPINEAEAARWPEIIGLLAQFEI